MPNASKERASTHTRPGPGTRTGRVWEIADEITRETGRRAARSEVVERFMVEDGNPSTASTQFQYWKQDYQARPAVGAAGSSDELRDVERQSLRVATDGRVLIPLEMREAMLLDEDGRVAARVEGGGLHLISRAVAVKRVQDQARKYKSPGESVVDRFLADRRAEWGEE